MSAEMGRVLLVGAGPGAADLLTVRALRAIQGAQALLYDALDRLGVKYWPSAANFVLARFGPGLGRVIDGLAEREIVIRDRSRDPGCAGCARITTGVLEHTRRCVGALEEVLCGAA